MMKKVIAALLTAGLSVSLLTGCGSKTEPAAEKPEESTEEAVEEPAAEEPAVSDWKPTSSIDVVVLSSAGGGSDINTRAVIDTFAKIGVDADFVVDYKNDGGGAVGWQYVAEAKDNDNLLMCYGFGDVINQVDADLYGVDDYKAVALVSAEQLLLLSTPQCKYKDFNEAVEAAKNGTVVSIAGAGGVEPVIHQKLLEVTGLTESQMPYIRHNSNGESTVTMLGNHADYVIAKPSTCISYVESGDLIPYVAFQEERFDAPLDTAPTISELGYDHIEEPMWRGFAVPKTVSDEAYAYYCDIFTQLLESDEWMEDYVEKNGASPLFMVGDGVQEYMKETEDEYRALVSN